MNIRYHNAHLQLGFHHMMICQHSKTLPGLKAIVATI